MLESKHEDLWKPSVWRLNIVGIHFNGPKRMGCGPYNTGERCGSVMNPDSSCNELMAELGSTEVKMKVLLLIASRKWTNSVAEALRVGEPYQSLIQPTMCACKGLLRQSAIVTKFYSHMSFHWCRKWGQIPTWHLLASHGYTDIRLPLESQRSSPSITIKFLRFEFTEDLWDDLNRRVWQRHTQPQSLQQLTQVLQHSSTDNTQVGASMGRHCQAVIYACGGHTRYWTFVTLTFRMCIELWMKLNSRSFLLFC